MCASIVVFMVKVLVAVMLRGDERVFLSGMGIFSVTSLEIVLLDLLIPNSLVLLQMRLKSTSELIASEFRDSFQSVMHLKFLL
jgi:hypothetical protein